MPAAPKIFVSATGGDLGSIRQLVKEGLLSIGCHPVEQTNFAPDYRDVQSMLREKIGECQALIHIVGMRYGREPDPATLPVGAPRRSYTQMEYHLGLEHARARGDKRFRVYTFVCPEDFPYDATTDDESEDLRALQREHRRVISQGDRLFTSIKDLPDIEKRVRELQIRLEGLEEEGRRTSRRTLIGVSVLAALLLVLLLGVFQVRRYLAAQDPHGAFARKAAALGVDLDQISAKDFHIDVGLGEAYLITYTVVTNDRLTTLLKGTEGSIRFDDGAWATLSRQGDPTQLASSYYMSPGVPEITHVSMKFVPRIEQTGTPMLIGPFDYQIELRRPLLAEFKKRALQEPTWIEPKSQWRFPNWDGFVPAIMRVFLGTRPDSLYHQIVVNGPEVWEQRRARDYRPRPEIDFAQDAEVIFVQLEFFDGTRSDVREVRRVSGSARYRTPSTQNRQVGRPTPAPSLPGWPNWPARRPRR